MNKFNTVKRLALIIIGLNSGLSVKGMDFSKNKQGEIIDLGTRQSTVSGQESFVNHTLLDGLKKSSYYSKSNENMNFIQDVKVNENNEEKLITSLLLGKSFQTVNLASLRNDKQGSIGLDPKESLNLNPLGSFQTVKTIDLSSKLWEDLKKLAEGGEDICLVISKRLSSGFPSKVFALHLFGEVVLDPGVIPPDDPDTAAINPTMPVFKYVYVNTEGEFAWEWYNPYNPTHLEVFFEMDVNDEMLVEHDHIRFVNLV